MVISAVTRFFDKIVAFIIGQENSEPLSPERLREDYLVRFLLLMLPLIGGICAFDFVRGSDYFTVARIGVGISIFFCLFLLRRRHYRIAMDVLFFGSMVSVVGGVVAGSLLTHFSPAYVPLVFLILFAEIAINGLYSGCNGRAIALLLFALVYDTFEIFFSGFHDAAFAFSRVGVMVLHVAAYGISRFLSIYFDRVSRLAEARLLMNRRLEQLVEEAHAAGVARLESFSHDIRSPITAITGVQALLAATELNEEQQRYLDILAKSNHLMLELVESILDPEYRESSQPPEEPPLSRLLDAALNPFRALARTKGVELKRSISGNPPTPPLARADALRVLGNLIDNALKYTDSGTVVVSAAETEDIAARKELTITVSDTGRGMSEERLIAVREGNCGRDSSMASSRGIGLAGVRRTVESVDGTMTIDSTLGAGTTVTIRFPLSG